MIESLHISNYALIDRSELQLGKGFSVITGETGAGKSILLGALNLALGSRADSSVVRDKQGKCVVEVTFNVAEYGLEEWFKQNDLDYDDHSVVRRQVSADGKSRSFINDTPVTVKQLKEFGSFVIDIHSQHETLLLGKSDFQIELLDAFCGNEELLGSYLVKFKEYEQLTARLNSAIEEVERADSESEFLNYRYNMLQAANLRLNEYVELEEEIGLLQNAEQIKGSLNGLVHIIRDSDDNVLSNIKGIRSTLEKSGEFLPLANELSERLNSVAIELLDIADEADHSCNSIDCDSRRLQFVEERLGELYNLQLKFKVDNPDELITERDNIESKLATIESNSELVESLKKELAVCESGLKSLATELHNSRVKGQTSLVNVMVDLLKGLGINHPQLKVDIQSLDRYTRVGCDKISILFAANKNQTLSDIANVASGGELSRLMLAFKYVLAKCKKLPVVIFDEIDTGLSGQVAHKMAAMMREMSGFMQVIAISHLPQIASVGDWHFKVYKEDSEVETISKIKLLSKQERVEELAVMMSGSSVSSEALSAAEKLLNGE